MTKLMGFILGLTLAITAKAQNFTTEQSNASLKYFNGQVVAELTWLKQPVVGQKNQLKIDLKTANGQPYELDASDLKAGLFMTDMPDMGTSQQGVVAVADPSGNPLPGSFMINAMKLSMGGNWTLLLALPNPDGSGKTETQKFQFSTH